MSDEEKSEFLYGFDYDENDLVQKLKEKFPFLKPEKFKDVIKVKNVVIELEYEQMHIEFFGLCNSLTAMINFEYNEDFKVTQFLNS